MIKLCAVEISIPPCKKNNKGIHKPWPVTWERVKTKFLCNTRVNLSSKPVEKTSWRNVLLYIYAAH